jgi:hypothetical protein
MVPRRPLESSKSELGRLSRDVVERVPEPQRVREDGLPPGRPLFRSTTPHSGSFRDPHIDHVLKVPLQIVRSLKEGCGGLIRSPGGVSTRLMQSLLHKPAARLCTLGSCGRSWKSLIGFDSIDFMRERASSRWSSSSNRPPCSMHEAASQYLMHRGVVATYTFPGILYRRRLLTVLLGDDVKKWTPIRRSKARTPGHARV